MTFKRVQKARDLYQAIKSNPKALAALKREVRNEFGFSQIGDGTILKLLFDNTDNIIKIIETIAKLFNL